MNKKLLQCFGLMALAAVTACAQTYWSTSSSLDCSDLPIPYNQTVQLTSSPATYACAVTGTFVWLAAGGMWHTQIRISAPATNPIGVDYEFSDQNGNNLNLDTTMNNGSSVSSGNDVNFALNANQANEVELLGASGNGPGYNTQETGSVYVTIYCPDETTCALVAPQLIYSALPSESWSLSVPIAWDSSAGPGMYDVTSATQWSAVGIDNGGADRVSLVVFNQNDAAASFNVDIYNNTTGALVATGTTPSIPAYGTYGALLSQVISSPLPAGPFKIYVDGGSSNFNSVEVLQVTGPSATTLQVAADSPPGTGGVLVRPKRNSRPRKLTAAKHPFAAATR